MVVRGYRGERHQSSGLHCCQAQVRNIHLAYRWTIPGQTIQEGTMPDRRETLKLTHDARKKQRQENHGGTDIHRHIYIYIVFECNTIHYFFAHRDNAVVQRERFLSVMKS